MSSSRAPSNPGIVSLTRRRRARIPSVPSITSAASRIHSARTLRWSTAAVTASSASTLPLAVYRCSSHPAARRRLDPTTGSSVRSVVVTAPPGAGYGDVLTTLTPGTYLADGRRGGAATVVERSASPPPRCAPFGKGPRALDGVLGGEHRTVGRQVAAPHPSEAVLDRHACGR